MPSTLSSSALICYLLVWDSFGNKTFPADSSSSFVSWNKLLNCILRTVLFLNQEGISVNKNPRFDESFSIPFWAHNASLWQMHYSLTHLGERLRIWYQTELCSPIILLALGKPMQSLKTIPKSPASVLIALNNDSPVASITGINPKKQDPIWSVVSSKNLTQIQMCFSQLISVDSFAKCKTSFL